MSGVAASKALIGHELLVSSLVIFESKKLGVILNALIYVYPSTPPLTTGDCVKKPHRMDYAQKYSIAAANCVATTANGVAKYLVQPHVQACAYRALAVVGALFVASKVLSYLYLLTRLFVIGGTDVSQSSRHFIKVGRY